MPKISIIGTVGVPANYGGFETLAENLVRYHHSHGLSDELHVYCSAKAYPIKTSRYLSASTHYIPLSANGFASIAYDAWSLLLAAIRGTDRVLLLGVSGAFFIPFLRLTRTKIITNIDGIEWKRAKWNPLAQLFLRLSEMVAVRYSHEVIADNTAIAEYVRSTYRRNCYVIAYGGDHALQEPARPYSCKLPARYAFALCRIEPENNVGLILRAFAKQSSIPLVFVGNWASNSYSKHLYASYLNNQNIYLLDPIYDLGVLRYLRERAVLYVHGHSAGGTNPSLVEMMHFGVPVAAYDCAFNRYTTDNRAWYFSSESQLLNILLQLDSPRAEENANAMRHLAQTRYTWDIIASSYFELLK